MLRARHSRNPTQYSHIARLRLGFYAHIAIRYISNDTYGLLRAKHSRNPTQYSHIARLRLSFYAHIVAGLSNSQALLCKHNVHTSSETLGIIRSNSL
ncbi:hypothetical protein DW152_11330 [Dorea sp. AM13-35]|nr:hypothetical protein DW152_11330 [Dorea sp. AM13-35]